MHYIISNFYGIKILNNAYNFHNITDHYLNHNIADVAWKNRHFVRYYISKLQEKYIFTNLKIQIYTDIKRSFNSSRNILNIPENEKYIFDYNKQYILNIIDANEKYIFDSNKQKLSRTINNQHKVHTNFIKSKVKLNYPKKIIKKIKHKICLNDDNEFNEFRLKNKEFDDYIRYSVYTQNYGIIIIIIYIINSKYPLLKHNVLLETMFYTTYI